MTKNGKILLGCGGVLIVIGVIVIVGGYFAMNYAERRLEESSRPDVEAGASFGKTVDQQGCIDEGLRRAKSMTIFDIGKGTSLDNFIGSCLKSAAPVKDFCVGVPGFWNMNDSQWVVEQCRKAGVDEKKSGCSYVFQAKHHYCSPPA